MNRIAIALACLSAGIVLSACGGCSNEDHSGRLRIVCTTGMIGDVAKRVAGDRAEVESLMGPGVDPHLYKASEGDVGKLSAADVVLYNGLNLEGKMGDIFVKLAATRKVVAVSETIGEEHLREPPEFLGHYDPHVWFDCSLWAKTIQSVEKALAEKDPSHAAEYHERAEALRKEYLELDAWIVTRIAEIPEGQRVMVTAHDAFGYFGRRYGLEVIGLQGISTVSEAGIKDVERVVGIIVDRKIRSIFVESSVPKRSIEAVQAACRDRGHEVAIADKTLFSDAMGAAGSDEGTYPGMVRHNVNTVVESLE